MLKRIVVILLFLLAFPASALGDVIVGEHTPMNFEHSPVDEALSADLLAKARGPWPNSPCAGRERITILPRNTKLFFDYPDSRVRAAAVASPSDCLVVVAPQAITHMNVYSYWCLLLTHEFGHLAGYGHTSDPRDVMYGDGALSSRVIYSPCYDYARYNYGHNLA